MTPSAARWPTCSFPSCSGSSPFRRSSTRGTAAPAFSACPSLRSRRWRRPLCKRYQHHPSVTDVILQGEIFVALWRNISSGRSRNLRQVLLKDSDVPHEQIGLRDPVGAEAHPVLDLHLWVSAVNTAVVAVVVDVARHPAAGADAVVALERFQFGSAVIAILFRRILGQSATAAQICKLLSVRSLTHLS